MKTKTRMAYMYSKKTGKLLGTQDTVKEALKGNMMVSAYEKELVKLNPQLNIRFVVE